MMHSWPAPPPMLQASPTYPAPLLLPFPAGPPCSTFAPGPCPLRCRGFLTCLRPLRCTASTTWQCLLPLPCAPGPPPPPTCVADGLHAQHRVLVPHAVLRLHAQLLRGQQERVGRGLAVRHVLTAHDGLQRIDKIRQCWRCPLRRIHTELLVQGRVKEWQPVRPPRPRRTRWPAACKYNWRSVGSVLLRRAHTDKCRLQPNSRRVYE